jgi:omega-6 fatty acid desaturase (delta-12 desaturase)
MGDIWTMTVDEYQASPRWLRIVYRAFRNPLAMFGIEPLFYFFVSLRFWQKGAPKKQKLSVLLTNLILFLIVGTFYLTIGLYPFFAIQIPITLIGGAIGFWLFYIQHQFEGVYWARQEDWNPSRAALEGSSFYQLPKVLHWISGNIGYHHIHHVRPLIPNYNLPQCYREIPEFQAVPSLTMRKSLASLSLNLWHEQQNKLVSFRVLKKQ